MRSLLVLAVLATPAAAQIHSWTNSSGGSWTDPANWDPGVPNANTHIAILSAAGPYTVSLDSLIILRGLQGPHANVTLDLLPSGSLQVREDGVTFPGTIRLLGTSGSQSSLSFELPALLTGGGTVALDGEDSLGAFFSSSALVIIDSGFTVRGTRGQLVGPRTNNGLILAEGPILNLGGTTTNNTLIKAVPGGRMQINSAIVSQSPTAEILADGGWIDFLGNTTISGGTIRSTNNGTVIIAALASTLTFNGVSFAGPVGLRGSFMQVNSGGLTINKGGVFTINDNQTSGGTLTFSSSGTINGPGTVHLNGLIPNTAGIAGPTSAPGVTLGPMLTVAGTGRLNGRINVSGRIAPGPIGGGVGSMTFSNALVMQPSGILDLEVASPNSQDIDRLTHTSTINGLTAGGTLRIRPAAGFVPAPGLSWVAIQADIITGSFASIDLPAPAAPVIWSAAIVGDQVIVSTSCYANCDGSTGSPVLTANDFTCFINAYATNQPYANCDASTGTPKLTGNDFTCFLNAYAAGCS